MRQDSRWRRYRTIIAMTFIFRVEVRYLTGTSTEVLGTVEGDDRGEESQGLLYLVRISDGDLIHYTSEQLNGLLADGFAKILELEDTESPSGIKKIRSNDGTDQQIDLSTSTEREVRRAVVKSADRGTGSKNPGSTSTISGATASVIAEPPRRGAGSSGNQADACRVTRRLEAAPEVLILSAARELCKPFSFKATYESHCKPCGFNAVKLLTHTIGGNMKTK